MSFRVSSVCRWTARAGLSLGLALSLALPAKAQAPLLRLVDAVAQGQFHIYSAASFDEALQLRTGCSAGSVDAAVIARVEQLHALARSFNGGRGKDD